MKKKLFILDGHALCYRAYYALIKNPLTNSHGQNISAIFGFAKMLIKLINEQSPDYLAVAFDPPQKSFRFKLYAEYKANRQKMPDEMRNQIDEIKNMVKTLGITMLVHLDYEADDILGTVAERFSSDEIDIYLVTGDKDAYQLVNDNVLIYANTKGISEYEIYDRSGIIEKIGISPEQVIDYMALMGDSADNIPGVKGIGVKTALKLITEFGSLEKIYANANSVKGKTGELLKEFKDAAFLSRELVTIKRDVPLEIDLKDMAFIEIDHKAAVEYFNNLEMASIAKDFISIEKSDEKNDENIIIPGKESLKEKNYKTIKDENDLKEMIDEIKKSGLVSFDTETDSLHPVEANLVGMSFSIEEHSGWFLPLQSKGLFGEDYLDPSISLPLVKSIIEDDKIKKIGQNLKFDLLVLKTAGIELRGIYFDTMIASYLLNPSERRHNMDELATQYLNYKTISFKELIGTGKSAIPITEVPLEKLAEYAIEDADITFRLYKLFKPKLDEENLTELFETIEMPLLPVLADMEYTGVKIDILHFEDMKETIVEKVRDTEKKIYELAGQKFNINSTKELSSILFEKLKLKTAKKTKTGFSTDIQVLETLKGSHKIIDSLIAYRTLSKLHNTYIDSLPKLISKKTGRIHTSYNQTVTATGRLSSSDPNLQNIPIRDEFGSTIRKGFIPEKGYLLMSADYSQIELRLAAHYSDDKNMKSAFNDNIDIHNMTASSVFGSHIDEVTPDMRRQAKIINFATIYGVSPYGLSQQAEISVKDASEFIKKYFETYPGFRTYIDTTIDFAKKHGYVKTLMGRKRPVPDINSSTSFRREGAERVAINTPIQGTSADMIKIAMIRISDELKAKKLKSHMILQVHDELVFEVHEDEIDIMKIAVKDIMENALKLNVPIVVDIGIGKSWNEAH
ncbi:MAG: DNA polymerase I [Leptospirales bacterium]|nr:DNA polymerase I [Leptospirales bacterium]